MIYPYVLEVTKCAVQGVTISFSLFCHSGKAGGAQILRYQGIAVNYYGFTLGALALIPSGFCNDGVQSISSWSPWGYGLLASCACEAKLPIVVVIYLLDK